MLPRFEESASGLGSLPPGPRFRPEAGRLPSAETRHCVCWRPITRAHPPTLFAIFPLIVAVHFDSSRHMDLAHATEALRALAQESRLKVFRLLVRTGPSGMAAGDIARKLTVPHNTMSSQLTARARAAHLVAQGGPLGDLCRQSRRDTGAALVPDRGLLPRQASPLCSTDRIHARRVT
jgi:hypothetical protein